MLNLIVPEVGWSIKESKFNNVDFPDPIGVLYAIEDTTYEDMMVNQIKEATKKKAKGTIQDIINAGDTWVV